MPSAAQPLPVPGGPSRPRRLTPRRIALTALLLPPLLVVLYALAIGLRYTGSGTPAYDDPERNFKYGSIGTESGGGVPFWVWKALPAVFDEETDRIGYYKYGLIFELDEEGNDLELPVGLSRRKRHGVEMVWFNCAACHTGSFRERKEAPRVVVPGMPANTLDFQGLLEFLFEAAADERFNPDRLIPAMELVGADLDWVERFVYRHFLIPEARERLLRLRSRLLPLMARQPRWGQGRADFFNPMRALLLDQPMKAIVPTEALGITDFPSLWLQGPRTAMSLHWDGNNNSLDERVQAAALALGAAPETIDRKALARVKTYLDDLPVPSNPKLDRVEPALVERGRGIYQQACAACHGSWEGTYSFQGERLGTIEPVEQVGTDPGRFQAFTEDVAAELGKLFLESPALPFKHFRKTRGYANLPLDGLWLRAPYLHNGSVPSLRDLLLPPDQRPKRFFRGNNLLDLEDGGFLAGPCNPETRYQFFFCFDTTLPGNGNGGHLYGTDLPEEDRRALLEYLHQF